MATSLHFIEHSIIIRPSEPHIYSRSDAFTLSGFTTAFKPALNEWNSMGHRVGYIIMTGLIITAESRGAEGAAAPPWRVAQEKMGGLGCGVKKKR